MIELKQKHIIDKETPVNIKDYDTDKSLLSLNFSAEDEILTLNILPDRYNVHKQSRPGSTMVVTSAKKNYIMWNNNLKLATMMISEPYKMILDKSVPNKVTKFDTVVARLHTEELVTMKVDTEYQSELNSFGLQTNEDGMVTLVDAGEVVKELILF